MIREPLSPSDEPNGPPSDPSLATPPTAWTALAFATIFILLAFYQLYLMIRKRAWCTWTLVAASILQNISMVAHTYDLGYPASIAWYVVEGLVYQLAPTLVMVACVQTFGRAAWHSILTEPDRLSRFWGFARWNTTIFVTFMTFSYIFFVIGNMTTVAVASDAVAGEASSARTVRNAIAVVEAGLIIQSIFLLAFTILVWRWKVISRGWDPEWDPRRKFKWTWKRLLTATLVCVTLLMARQIFLILVFFHVVSGVKGLHFVFDVAPLLVTVVILSIWHPGRCLPRSLTSIRLTGVQSIARKSSTVSSEASSDVERR